MRARTILPALLLAALAAAPAAQALGTDPEVQVRRPGVPDLPADVPCQDEPVETLLACLLTCTCPPPGPVLIAYLQEAVHWADEYGDEVREYTADRIDEAIDDLGNVVDYLHYPLAEAQDYLARLVDWLVCVIASPSACGPMPFLASPPLPPLPPQPPLPPSPPGPPTWP